MRGKFLFALFLLAALLPGCDDRAAGDPAPADEVVAPAPAGGGNVSVYPLSTGAGYAGGPAGGASASGEYAPPAGDGMQATPFVSEPYVVGERPTYNAAPPIQSGTRYPSPYDALFQGPYGSRSYSTQPYVTTIPAEPAVTYSTAPTVTTVPVVPAQPVATYTYSNPPTVTYSAPAVTTAPAQPVVTYPAPIVTTVPAVPAQPTATYTYSNPPSVTYSAPATAYSPAAVTETATVREVGGLQLVPATDIPPGNHPEDAAPSQWFEILRPGNGPLRIGRVSATCVCVGVRVPKRSIAAGERALIEARTLTKPPRNNLTYGIFVNIVEPQTVMLDTDVTIRY